MFEWDDAKNRADRKKHGVSFEDVVPSFAGPMFVAADDRGYREARYVAIGFLEDVPVVVVYAERCERIRIVSARKADRHERQRFKEFLDRLGR